jgi:capsular exopolysaccharide synthesis family protein
MLGDASLFPASANSSGAGPINFVQAMLRVFAHHWWKVLVIWAVLTAGLAFAINVRVKPTYESASLLRVEPANRDLFGPGLYAAEVFDHFLQTQVALIQSPNVLNAAVIDKDVAGTALIRQAKDPENELRARLQVFVLGGTYLIRVGLTSQQPEDGPVIVNAVVKAYLNVAALWSGEQYKSQIKRLNEYKLELTDRVEQQKKIWLDLAGRSTDDLVDSTRSMAAPTTPTNSAGAQAGKANQVTLEEYRQVREQLFATNMKLIETEALFKNRQAEINARMAGVDPDVLFQKRMKEALRKDPEIAQLMKEIDQVQRRVEMADYRTRAPSDPSLVHLRRQLDALKQDLHDLAARKQEELGGQIRELGVEGATLQELTGQIESMKIRKSSYDKLLNQLELATKKEATVSAQIALVREDLTSLRDMRMSVEKRMEQLEFDSRGEARINQIDPARPGVLIKDSRRKYLMMAPVGVIAVVLGLFLFLEIRSGRVADLDEVSRRVPVEVFPVPSLPGTRRTSDQRSLRANEAQLQVFLQSLDHLRVSLWYGKDVASGSGRCLVVTSAIGSEGKTTLSAHLAVCCAKAGISTLVIDADLRRAALSRMFEEEQTAGLSDVLKGDLPPEEAVVALRDGGFHLLPAGSPGQHPGWLFREQRIGQVLARYRQMFDLIILDTPPVLPVADALSLGRWVDGAIMVMRYDMSRFPLVERARRRLISAGIPILKTVVNGVKTSRFGSGYGYGYGYGYGDAYGYGDGYSSRTVTADRQGSSGADGGTGIVATDTQETSSL